MTNKNPDAHDPNASTADPTDGREPYEWNSKYPPEATRIIRCESFYLFFLLILSLVGLLLTWNRFLENVLIDPAVLNPKIFRIYSYYCFAGLLGGTTFSIKYMYRVVARGYWHMDRQIWRILSPFMSISVSFAVGALISASYIGANTVKFDHSAASAIAIGFLTGYFADQAIGKMYEVAMVLFGPTSAHHHHKK